MSCATKNLQTEVNSVLNCATTSQSVNGSESEQKGAEVCENNDEMQYLDLIDRIMKTGMSHIEIKGFLFL